MSSEDLVVKAFQAVVKASGADAEQIRSRVRRFDLYTARGVFFLLCRELGLHPSLYGAYIGRSRPSTVITTKRYFGYYLSRDRIVVELIDKTRKIFYGNE